MSSLPRLTCANSAFFAQASCPSGAQLNAVSSGHLILSLWQTIFGRPCLVEPFDLFKKFLALASFLRRALLEDC